MNDAGLALASGEDSLATRADRGAVPRAAIAQLVVGVTGHRNVQSGEVAMLRARVRGFLAGLQRDFPNLPLTVLSSLAEGADQLAAEEALALGARLIAPLPFARDLYVRDFANAAARAHFDALCAAAQVIELPLSPGHTRADIHDDGPARDRQYADAGLFVARHCHLLLAVWDGKDSARLGGTGQIVDYYLTGALPSAAGRRRRTQRWLSGEGDERLLCQLVCSRAAPDGAPVSPLQPGQVLWRTANSVGEPDAPMPASFRQVFRHADEFNQDATKYRASIAAAQAQAAAADGASGSGLFAAADWLAMHFQRRVLLGMRIIYTAAALMGIAFTAYDNLPQQDDMLYVFLVLFTIGVVTSVIAKRRAWHRRYLDYRALAEGLRVQRYWRRAGIALVDDPEFAHDSLMQKQDIALGWVRNVMRSAELDVDAAPARPDAAAVRGVIDDWVGDDEHGELGYYRRRSEQRERTHHFNETVGTICLLAAILISVFMAAFLRHLSYDAKNDLITLMSVFSIFAAVREAYSFRKADRELIRQYRFMRRVFGAARKALDRAEDVHEQRSILRALGEAALAEHVEWAVLHRERPVEAARM